MLGNTFDNVRRTAPLVHCITNYVTVNDVANILLACGASPVMADEPEDALEITAISDGLTVNMGTLNKRTIETMFAAGHHAKTLGHPVLLDPVGAGASTLRTQTALGLMEELQPDAIRGNLSEIRTLVCGSGNTRGVDADLSDTVTSQNLPEMVAFVKDFARRANTIAAVTGAIDLVSDGETCYVIRNGRPEMSRVTGTGCQLSALMTASIASNPDCPLEAAAAAVAAMGIAGETAWKRMQNGEGNASYRIRMIDAVYNMTGEQLEREVRYEIW